MKTFHIQTLGCKVNHYESEQIATLLRARGLAPADAASADLRVINTCSVTTQAASQSRQSVRRMARLPMLSLPVLSASPVPASACHPPAEVFSDPDHSPHPAQTATSRRPRVLVTGCWATSNPADATALAGVDGVLGHHHDVALELNRLLTLWETGETQLSAMPGESLRDGDTGQEKPENPPSLLTPLIQPKRYETVNGKLRSAGTTSLPLLGIRQGGRQRAFLKIQDGCDAHCTYCIIPTLRPTLWSKPIESAVEEARSLVAAGHVEIILTGIFLGAYGQPTALRRRQPQSTGKPLAALLDALCTRVAGLRRLRLSSLEPGDLTDELIAILRDHPAVVPHFHLPLQSGSDALLHKMNRQYTRDDFLRMVDRVRTAFDRPALTTDIVVGFPGETDDEFERSVEVSRASGFIHIHAFPYSPRPGTAAARWTKQFVRGPVVNERIERLKQIALEQSFDFRSTFIGQTVEVIIERDGEENPHAGPARHGRCERYFSVNVNDASLQPGDAVSAKIVDVTQEATFGIAAAKTDSPPRHRSTEERSTPSAAIQF